MIELAKFENLAIDLKERETEVFWGKTELAHCAVEHDDNILYPHPDVPRAAPFLAHLWGCSMQAVNTLARIFETFSEDEITPDIPLSLWNAVMETDDPRAWLGRAIAEGLSARQVRDANDNLRLKGKHLSSCKFEGEVEVLEWEPVTGRFAVTGLPISGDKPQGLARVTVREILEKGDR